MPEITPSHFRWLRFGLSHLFVLTLGIALGFAPLKLWELNQRGEPRIATHVKVIELPRDQVASLGINPQQSAGGIPLTSLDRSFHERLKSLTAAGRARILAEPVLMTVSGRASAFNVGGEIPITTTRPDGIVTVEYRPFGTNVDILPTLLRNGRIRVELESRISTAEQVAQKNGTNLPSFRSSTTKTELDLASGETALICVSTQGEKETKKEYSLLILATVERDPAR